MSTPDTVGEVKSFFSPAASRSIAGGGVSHIGEVAHIVMEGLKMSRTDLLPSKFQIDPEQRKPSSYWIRCFQVNEMYIGELSEI